MTVDWLEVAARQFEPAADLEFETPGALARHLDPRTVQTPMLDKIDEACVDVLERAYRSDSPVGPRLIVTMPPQEGKLVADDTPVATPGGWTLHGDLKPGDLVFHPSGIPTRVLEVHEPSQASIRVHFSDHSHVDVHPRHEWTLHDRATGRVRTVETRVLLESPLGYGIGKRGGRYRWSLPAREALQMPDADLPIDPYTLGVWLGDGTTSKGAITHHPDDRYDLPYPVTSRHVHSTTGIVTTYYGGGFPQALRSNGLMGDKHIPTAYLRASIQQRRSLLEGLIDTDGHVSNNGQVSFDNANAGLVQQVAELLRTLGYRAYIHKPTPPKMSTSGIQGRQEMWRVTFTPHDQIPARLARKREGKRLGVRRRIAVVAVEKIQPRRGRCITVASPDGLYLVGESMTPTHNSQRLSRRFPLWALLRNPELRIAIASYEANVARRWGRAIRDDIIGAPELGLRISSNVSAQHEWQLGGGHTGGVYTAGVGGSLTGRPVDLMIIDDPVKDREQADSDTYRDKVWDWWTDTVMTRLAPGAPVILIMTRWHPDDLAGRLIEQGGWDVLSIAAECDDADTDPLGREPGEFLESSRGRTREQWLEIKNTQSTRTWEALYQQRPTPAEGLVFKRPWIDAAKLPSGKGAHRFVRRIVAVDPAAKDGKKSDYTGIIVVALDDGGHAWVLDDRTLRGSPSEWGLAAWGALIRWRCNEIVVEDNQGGQMVAHVLDSTWQEAAELHDVDMIVPTITTVTARESKRVRAESIAGLYEHGKIHHAADGTGRLDKLEDQMTTWTGDTKKSPDRLDALVHGLRALTLPRHRQGTGRGGRR